MKEPMALQSEYVIADGGDCVHLRQYEGARVQVNVILTGDEVIKLMKWLGEWCFEEGRKRREQEESR